MTGCSAAPQFRWSRGATLLRDWSLDPRLTLLSPASGSYRLDVRCGDCASGVCSASDGVSVIVDPDLVPGDLGNTVLAVRRGADVLFAWGVDALARSYSLHRGTAKDQPLPAVLTLLPAPAATLPDLPPPPPLYFYRATGASCSGREGP